MPVKYCGAIKLEVGDDPYTIRDLEIDLVAASLQNARMTMLSASSREPSKQFVWES